MQTHPVGLSSVSVGPIEDRFAGLGTGNFLIVGGYGCTLSCSFCTNHDVSHALPVTCAPGTASWIAERSKGLGGVLFTHSEPIILSSLIKEVTKLVRPSKVAAKTSAYCNHEDFMKLMDSVDAINVDVKGGREEYRNLCEGSLDMVVRNLSLAKSTGKVLELTFLVIPGMEDGLREAINMVHETVGSDVVSWVIGFVPSNRMTWWPMAKKANIDSAVVELRRYFKDVRAR